MAKNAYIGVNNVARKITQPYIGVDNVARKVTSGYVGVDNVARQFYTSGSTGPRVGDLAVGTSVYINNQEYIVIHQGLPSDAYDSSCNGTWLMCKYLSLLDPGSISSYLNTNLFSTYNIGEAMRDVIKHVKIPRDVGAVIDHEDCQAFLLSLTEVGLNQGATLYEGAVLDYFKGADASKLIAVYPMGSMDIPVAWFLRTYGGSTLYMVSSEGTVSLLPSYGGSQYGIRPAFILPSDTEFDENYNIIA